MPFERKLPPTQCNISSYHQIHRKPGKIYIGLTERPRKQRSYSHKLSFTNKKYAHITALSKYLWDLKDKIQDIPEISWKIKKFAPAYNNNSKRCILCLEEKMAIITFPEQQKLLNKISELISKCRHKNKFLLHYYDSKDLKDIFTNLLFNLTLFRPRGSLETPKGFSPYILELLR